MLVVNYTLQASESIMLEKNLRNINFKLQLSKLTLTNKTDIEVT